MISPQKQSWQPIFYSLHLLTYNIWHITYRQINYVYTYLASPFCTHPFYQVSDHSFDPRQPPASQASYVMIRYMASFKTWDLSFYKATFLRLLAELAKRHMSGFATWQSFRHEIFFLYGYRYLKRTQTTSFSASQASYVRICYITGFQAWAFLSIKLPKSTNNTNKILISFSNVISKDLLTIFQIFHISAHQPEIQQFVIKIVLRLIHFSLVPPSSKLASRISSSSNSNTNKNNVCLSGPPIFSPAKLNSINFEKWCNELNCVLVWSSDS